ncbi:exonuclease phage-type/recb c-terminal domain-containing protein [Holotrichia oblita]|uniref:Exonuclease phage-type/recb c-terminal domain-containing protein n=1 Tax=Holotrichia oblita TaxID=644536 RepID=A0ACB9TMI1_HOLOL|nr:exonuclease phage-type/recb c-terminal domain-containing protein [Holotrichia oblita]
MHAVQVWVMCQDNGAVETAHCTCMAGAGEVCSHVGTLLYALRHVQATKESTSCTDITAAWNVPKVAKVEYQPLKNMDLGRIIAGHKLVGHIPPISPDEMVTMLKNIEEESSSVLMRVLEPFASEMEVVPESVANIYRLIYNPAFEQLGYDALLQKATAYSEITLSIEDCQKVQAATRQQAQSSLWFQQRAGRITASNFRAVCRTTVERPSKSLIKIICYPTNFLFKTKATIWGTTHEKDGLAAYHAYSSPMHEGLRLEQVGLCLSPTYMQYGASPDSMVTCECCGTGCVEVKCPYLLKHMTIEEFANLKSSCLEKSESGELCMKKDVSYYYQVQMQMAITGVGFCDFAIWGPNELYLERVLFDEDFWASESSKAIEFHSKVIMPELLGRFFTRTAEEAVLETWCLCEGIDDGRPMICCDNDDCLVKWHHLECAGLEDIPSEPWYCGSCASQF